MSFDIWETGNAWIAQGKQIAIATVVSTWGSAPRQAGAKMLATSESVMIGSVSGGCVEAAVVEEMLQSLKDKKPRLLHYGVSDDTAWELGLACGGKIDIFLEPLDLAWWQLLQTKGETSFKTITFLTGENIGQKRLVDETFPPEILNLRKTQLLQFEAVDILLEVHEPGPRLVIIGGAHLSQALSQFAKLLGFRVYIIEPRSAFATTERFPDVLQLSHDYPNKALEDIPLDSNTFVAVLSHDPKIDDPALIKLLPSQVAYIGVLSSKRSHEKRLERLRAAGIHPDLFSRMHTPIGLEIGAKSPEEIALAIMAQIVAIRNH